MADGLTGSLTDMHAQFRVRVVLNVHKEYKRAMIVMILGTKRYHFVISQTNTSNLEFSPWICDFIAAAEASHFSSVAGASTGNKGWRRPRPGRRGSPAPGRTSSRSRCSSRGRPPRRPRRCCSRGRSRTRGRAGPCCRSRSRPAAGTARSPG